VGLPAVTPGLGRGTRRWRIVAACAAALLAFAGATGAGREPADHPSVPDSVSASLDPATAGARVPHSWLAGAPPRLSAGDRIDLLGVRPGDRAAGAIAVVLGARVVAAENDGFVLEAVSEDLAGLAIARAQNYVLLLVVHPAR
jgi:hypothetical protein